MNPGAVDRPRLLIAGIGNIFLGDDAFGVEVVQRLARRPLPETVRVVDFGIRGLDLAYALLENYEIVILVDACPRGGPPGTLYVIKPERAAHSNASQTAAIMEAHNLGPGRVLQMVAAWGGQVERLFLVGCEPSPGDAEEMVPEMSAEARTAVAEAVPLIEALIAQLLRGDDTVAPTRKSVSPSERVPQKEASKCHS